MEQHKVNYALNLNWDTEHDTARGIMTHSFSGIVKVVTNIKTGYVKVFKYDNLVNAFDASGWKLNDYTKFLAGLAADVAILQLVSPN